MFIASFIVAQHPFLCGTMNTLRIQVTNLLRIGLARLHREFQRIER